MKKITFQKTDTSINKAAPTYNSKPVNKVVKRTTTSVAKSGAKVSKKK